MAHGNGKEQHLKVLVVEDNEDLAVLLREQLQFYDCEVVVYSSDFAQLLRPEPWHGITAALVDMWLSPKGFGKGFPEAFEILQFLAEKFPNIVRVVYSAVPQQHLVHDDITVQQLAHYVFTKPLQTEVLVEALRG